MRKPVYFLCVCFCICTLGIAQEQGKPPLQPADSIPEVVQKEAEKLVIIDSTLRRKNPINPLAPSKAAFYSTVFPGLGQIYNKRYWKTPIVWAALGGSIYQYTLNNDNYNQFRTAFKRRQAGFTDDDFNGEGNFPFLSVSVLENQQERFQEQRDLWLVASIAIYILNIVDANVDAHLKQFNIDNDLSFDFEPYMDLDFRTNSPHYGMALTIKF